MIFKIANLQIAQQWMFQGCIERQRVGASGPATSYALDRSLLVTRLARSLLDAFRFFSIQVVQANDVVEIR
jgi:hypothetical protein